LYEKKNKSLVGLSFELKWSQLQPTTSLLRDYAHIKGALEFINTLGNTIFEQYGT